MPAKTDFEAVAWRDTDRNRSGRSRKTDVYDSFPQAEGEARWSLSPAETWEELRAQIKRGRDYLEQVRQELAESRSMLEQWPAFEFHCGKNPLAQLTDTVVVKERIEKFLVGWLQRREDHLNDLSTKMALASTGTQETTGPQLKANAG